MALTPDNPNGIFERSRTTPAGVWTTPTFNAANFTAAAPMTWTVESGDVTTYAYTLIGKTMTIMFQVTGSTLGNSASSIVYITIPGGYTCAKSTLSAVYLGGSQFAPLLGYCYAGAGTTALAIAKPAAPNFVVPESNTFQVYGQITIEVQ